MPVREHAACAVRQPISCLETHQSFKEHPKSIDTHCSVTVRCRCPRGNRHYPIPPTAPCTLCNLLRCHLAFQSRSVWYEMATALKSMPSAVGSVEELLALACRLEKEAAQRYGELAARMQLRGEGRLSALFAFLASIEEKHAAAVAQRAEQMIGATPLPDVSTRQVPESFDAEAGESSLLTPYHALAIAVRNETRAFAFYSYLAATAPDDSVRKVAEGLAKEELTHADLLRRERRKAYREQNGGGRLTLAQLPQTLSELWSLCSDTEAQAARYHRALSELLRRQNGAAATAFSAAAEDEDSCARQAAHHIGKSIPHAIDPVSPTIRGGRRLLEEGFERYSDIAARAKSEEVMSQALSLAERASRRLFLTSLALVESSNVERDHGTYQAG